MLIENKEMSSIINLVRKHFHYSDSTCAPFENKTDKKPKHATQKMQETSTNMLQFMAFIFVLKTT